MEKAKLKAQEIAEDLMTGPAPKDPEEVKLSINNLLHMHLDDDITMKECEILAVVIYDMIFNPYEYVKQEDPLKN